MTVGAFLLTFVAGKSDLGGIHDNYVIAHILVGSVGRLMLATQQLGGYGRQSSENDVFSVDDIPFLVLGVTGFRIISSHGLKPSFLLWGRELRKRGNRMAGTA